MGRTVKSRVLDAVPERGAAPVHGVFVERRLLKVVETGRLRRASSRRSRGFRSTRSAFAPILRSRRVPDRETRPISDRGIRVTCCRPRSA
jgi:hypothetical protein